MNRTTLCAARRPLAALALLCALVAAPASASAAGLNLVPRGELLVLNIVLFALLIYPVNRLIVQPLLRVLDERDRRTAGAEGEAVSLRTEAQSARAALEAGLIEARARAQARRTAILGAGEGDERALLEAARVDAARNVESVRSAVQSELEAARGALREDARALAREVATRVLGRAL